MNISIKLQIQKRKIEYKNNENNTKAKGEISMDFTGKNVIVTGGASGIGKAIVTGVVEGGGHAIIVDLNLDAAEKLREELGKDKTSAYKVNLANSAEIREVFGKIVADFKQIHGLINNAGIVSTVPFDAASKAGVIGLTKAVAREGAPYGVACNGVCPSLTMTPMTANMGEEKTKKIIATIPLGRGAQPREIANMVLFYASDLASFATGEISDVDGGVTMDG